MTSRARLFLAIVAAQAVFLLAWAGWHERIRATAPTILLKTRPADPQDLLRGDYMVLAYDISAVRLSWDPGRPATGDVYVVLARHGDYHEAVRASRSEPAGLGPDELWVVGRIEGAMGADEPRLVRVSYGIERYFVPQGKGRPPLPGPIEVEAAVGANHRLYLRRLLVDGRPYP